MKEETYRNQVRDADLIAAELRHALDIWLEAYREIGIDLASKFEQKRQALHLSIESWECPGAFQAFNALRSLVSNYNTVVSQLVKRIQEFKDGLNTEHVGNRIGEIERELTRKRLNLRRAQSDTPCENYLQTFTEKQRVENELQTLNTQLEQEQTVFIDQYFDAINTIFSQRGSQRFTISKRINRRGYMPTIQIIASFSGTGITPERIKSFFSESDRRALALSIFLAKAKTLSDDEKANTILVLDDPVTSFDDGRIDRTIRFLETERSLFRQMIILSHYSRYLRAFFYRTRMQTTGIQLIKIERDAIGSQLRSCTAADFIESPHEQMYRHLEGFIARRHREDISRDLRVYLEIEIRSRFHQQICVNNMLTFQFGDLLDNLLVIGAITQAQRDTIEQFRLSLNP